MASPFHVFRKHQKTLLVIAGVLLMFVFVVGDSLTQFVGGPSGGPAAGGTHPNDVAVQWSDGKLTNRELDFLVRRREIVKQFLIRLYQTGQAAALEAGGDPQLPLSVELVAVGEPEGAMEQNALRTRLLADKARSIGMEMSDENIRHYLMEVGRGRVSAEQMRQLLQHSEFRGGRIPTDFIFNALREELLARNYLASHSFAMGSIAPQQRWQDWLRVNERVTVEAAALPVQQFVVDVPDPSEEELLAFFEEFKEREPLPEVVDNTEFPSRNPGFARPRRVKLHFVKADFNDVVAQLAEEVTDEEIQKYYDENKDTYFRKTEIDFDAAPGEESEDQETRSEGDAAAAGESDQAGDTTGDGSSAAADALDASGEEAQEGGTEAIEEEEEEEEAQPENSAQASGETAADVPSAEADSAPADAASDVEDAGAQDAAEAAPSDQDQPADAASDEAEPGDQPVEYQPLEDVREEIRQALAQEKAAAALPERMGQVYSELRRVYQDWERQVFAAEDAGREPPPAPEELIELGPLAEKHGMQFQKTGELSRVELRDTPLGRSGNPQRFGSAELWLAEFVELQLHEPALTYDLDFNHYVSVKVEDTPERIPTFDEVRGDVVRAWKLRKAAELALKRAEEEAAKAEQSGLPLNEQFADDSQFNVVTTDSFSWLTIGNISPTTNQVFFRMSEPAGITAAGPDFMREVFGLQDNEVGAVLNHDHSIAYVVRIAQRDETREQLRQVFLAEADRWYGMPSMNAFHQRQAAQALLKDLFETNEVKWIVPPDQREEEETTS